MMFRTYTAKLGNQNFEKIINQLLSRSDLTKLLFVLLLFFRKSEMIMPNYRCQLANCKCGVSIWSTADWSLLFDAKIAYTVDLCFNESSTKLLTVSDYGDIKIIEINLKL